MVSFEITASPEQVERYREHELDIKITEHREKRTLTANAYYWQLLTKVAARLRISNAKCHNLHIRDYGFPVIVEGCTALFPLPDTEAAERTALEASEYHLKPTEEIDDMGRRVYMLMRGSHTYDSKEMARLIDGLVSSGKDLGIETLTPDELKRLKGYEK